jgi:hypothetical protein
LPDEPDAGDVVTVGPDVVAVESGADVVVDSPAADDPAADVVETASASAIASVLRAGLEEVVVARSMVVVVSEPVVGAARWAVIVVVTSVPASGRAETMAARRRITTVTVATRKRTIRILGQIEQVLSAVPRRPLRR